MRERVFLYGADGDQLGILAEGDGDNRLAVLFWNAGFLHRAGPYGSFTDLARRLARAGHVTFRFDLGGLGDSGAPRAAGPADARACADIRAAMDFVTEKTGVSRFVLVGLCSGADQAHPVALADERVAGFVALDGYMYRTWGWRLRHILHYARRVGSLEKWKAKLGRVGAPRTDAAIFKRTFPPRDRIRTELAGLLERGLKALFVYTGGAFYCNHAGQFRAALGADLADHPNLATTFFPRANHTYTLLGDRARLHDLICDWIAEQVVGSR